MEKRMMKAAVLEGPRRIEVKEVPVPEAREGEIQIKVSACGVCGSDVHMWKAGKGWGKGETADFTMGHEFCGVVTDPGVSDFKKGDRVVFWANLYCGECVFKRLQGVFRLHGAERSLCCVVEDRGSICKFYSQY